MNNEPEVKEPSVEENNTCTECEEQINPCENTENEVSSTEQDSSEQKQKKPEKHTKKAELEKAIAEKEEYLSALIRERADFDNYKKRNALSVSKAYQDGTASAAETLLPVLDNLTRATSITCQDEAYAKGVCLVLRQLEDAFSSLGIEEIKAEGQPFDPTYHNAVMQVPSEAEEESGIVKEVLMKGYKIGEKVIRHAMVKVTE